MSRSTDDATHYTLADAPVSRAGHTTAVCGARVNEYWGETDDQAPTCEKCRQWLSERNAPIRGEAMITHVTETTLEAMERYGGSFVRTLATLYRQGDPDNQAILRHAFGILFAQYAGMAELAKRQA